MMILVTPCEASVSIIRSRMGVPDTWTRHLGHSLVFGPKRLPNPAARITAQVSAASNRVFFLWLIKVFSSIDLVEEALQPAESLDNIFRADRVRNADGTRLAKGTPRHGSHIRMAQRELTKLIDIAHDLATKAPSDLGLDIEEQVEGSLRGSNGNPIHLSSDLLHEDHSLIENPVDSRDELAVFVFQGRLDRILRNAVGIRGRMTLQVLHRLDGGRRRRDVAHAPACQCVAFGEGIHQDRPLFHSWTEPYDVNMRIATPHQGGVALVEHDPEIALQS